VHVCLGGGIEEPLMALSKVENWGLKRVGLPHWGKNNLTMRDCQDEELF